MGSKINTNAMIVWVERPKYSQTYRLRVQYCVLSQLP